MKREQVSFEEVQKIEKYILSVTIRMLEANDIHYSLYCGSVLGCIRHSGSIPWDTDVDIIISINDYDRFISCCQKELIPPFYVQYYPNDPHYHCLHPRVGLTGADTDWIHVDVFMYSGLPEDNEKQLQFIREARSIVSKFHKKSKIRFTKSNIVENAARTMYHVMRSLFIPQTRNELHRRFFSLSKEYPVLDAAFVTEIGCNQYGEKKIYPKAFWEDTILREYEGLSVRVPREYNSFLAMLYGEWEKYPPVEEREKVKNTIFWADTDLVAHLKSENII